LTYHLIIAKIERMRGILITLILSLSLSACGTGLGGSSYGNNDGAFGVLRETFKF